MEESRLDITATKNFRTVCSDKRIVAICNALGASSLYLVGGAVRDVLLGQTPRDIDLATPMSAEDVLFALEKTGMRVIPTGLKHNTLTVIAVPESDSLEITTFRGDEASIHPLEDDLALRDFTINAMAYSLGDFCLCDPFGGQKDIMAKCVRALPEAKKRFEEDPLRVLRLVRIACELCFSIDPESLAAAGKVVPQLQNVSIERVRDEISKILLSKQPTRGFELLHNMGILGMFMPELEACVGFEQNEFHKSCVFYHTMEVVERSKPSLLARMSALLHDIGKPESLSVDELGARHFYRHEVLGEPIAQKLLERLRYPNELIKAVLLLIHTHMRPTKAGPGGYRRLLRDVGEYYDDWRALKEADALACKLAESDVHEELAVFDAIIDQIKNAPETEAAMKLSINGHDLMKLGIPEGPEIGKALNLLREHIIDHPEDNNPETLIQLLSQRKTSVEG